MIFSFFFFNQKTAYEMRISDWSSDVCSSDLSSKCITGTRLMRPPERPSSWAKRQRGDEALRLPTTRRAAATASLAQERAATLVLRRCVADQSRAIIRSSLQPKASASKLATAPKTAQSSRVEL